MICDTVMCVHVSSEITIPPTYAKMQPKHPREYYFFYFTETHSNLFSVGSDVGGVRQGPKRVLLAHWQNFKQALHILPLEGRAYFCGQAPLISIQMRHCAMKEQKNKKIKKSQLPWMCCQCTEDRDETYCFVLTLFKGSDCSGGKSILSLFRSICGRVT